MPIKKAKANNEEAPNKDKKVEAGDPAEKEPKSEGEKFFSEFSRSDFIKEGEVDEIDITEAFDAAEEIGFDDDNFKDDDY